MKANKVVFKSFLLACIFILLKCSGPASGDSVSSPVVDGDQTTMHSEGGGIRFDNKTELQTGYNGLTLRDVYIVDGNDRRITGSEVALNSTFSVIYEGVENYTPKNGKAFPDLSIHVSDTEQNPVLLETDLLASYKDGLSLEDASVLRASVTVGDPMKPGKYICSIQIADKNNPDSGIISTWSFDVK